MEVLTSTNAAEREVQLREQGIFAGLSEDSLAALENRGCYVEFENEWIAHENEQMGFFYYLVTGVVDITKQDVRTKQARTIASLVPGQCLGEMSFLLGTPASASVRVREAATTWSIRHNVLRHFICTNPDGGILISNIAALLAQRLVQTNERLVR